MPRINTTIDNINPMIIYQPVGAWLEGSTVSDPQFSSYFKDTFTTTIVNGASATFHFNGTGVWIYGAKRGNHGPYIVSLDGNATTQDGFAPGPGLFQFPLFSARNISSGQHTVVITNAETDPTRQFLDIDFIQWECEIGSDTEVLSSTQVEDTDSAVSYQPSTAWNTQPEGVSFFSGASGHGTLTTGATASFTFQTLGDTVSAFGSIGPDNGEYVVQVDSGSSSTFNAAKQNFTTGVLLYYASSLGPGLHTLNITNPTNGNLGIDYFITSTVPSVSGNAGSSGGDDGSVNVHTIQLSGALIGAIVVVVVVIVAAAIGPIWFIHRRKRARARELIDLSGPSMSVGRFSASSLEHGKYLAPQHGAYSAPQHPMVLTADHYTYQPHGKVALQPAPAQQVLVDYSTANHNTSLSQSSGYMPMLTLQPEGSSSSIGRIPSLSREDPDRSQFIMSTTESDPAVQKILEGQLKVMNRDENREQDSPGCNELPPPEYRKSIGS